MKDFTITDIVGPVVRASHGQATTKLYAVARFSDGRDRFVYHDLGHLNPDENYDYVRGRASRALVEPDAHFWRWQVDTKHEYGLVKRDEFHTNACNSYGWPWVKRVRENDQQEWMETLAQSIEADSQG